MEELKVVENEINLSDEALKELSDGKGDDEDE